MAKKSDSNPGNKRKCPDCKKGIPPAFKSCSDCSKSNSALRKTRGTTRRPQRTTREKKPQYFDSSAFQKKKKKQTVPRKPVSGKVKEITPVKPKTIEKPNPTPSTSQPTTPKGKKVKKTRVPKDTEEESSNIILQEKSKECSIILAEINRKLVNELKNHSTLSHLQSSPLFEDILKFFEKFQNSYDGTDTWFETSSQGYGEYVTLEGCNNNIWKTGGYSNVFKLLLKQMPGQTPIDLSKKILLNKEVQKISWGDSNSVVATCADGTEYAAEKILSSVSLGVLKARSELFVPPLPSWKTSAIQGLFIGTVDKIFIKFPHRWWPEGNIGFNFFWTEGDEKRVLQDVGGVNGTPWVVDAFGFYLTTQDPLTFLGWVSGPQARYMETLSDEQVSIDTMKLFRHFLGANYTIPEPVRVIKTTWGTNPHFLGSYSCRSLSTDRLNTSAAELGKPVHDSQGKSVLLFAGEATHEHYYSTVHGAVASGWREADRILKSEALLS